jgi:hypothetical protein
LKSLEGFPVFFHFKVSTRRGGTKKNSKRDSFFLPIFSSEIRKALSALLLAQSGAATAAATAAADSKQATRKLEARLSATRD